MQRLAALALGVLVAGLALGPGHVKAGEKPEEQAGERVERHVVVRQLAGSMLGVGLEDTEGDVRGARVASVEEGTPAEKAGIQKGDVIVRFDGEGVRSAKHLARLVGETPAARPVAIEVSRGGTTQKLTATLVERKSRIGIRRIPGAGEFHFEMPEFDVEVPEPPEPPVAPHPPAPPLFSWRGDDGRDLVLRMWGGGPRKLGIAYMEIGEQLAAYFKLSGKTGVLVSAVDSDGPAARAGMKAGDVILKLAGEKIEDGSDLREAVAEAKGGTEVAVTVQRDGRPVDLKVELAKPEPRPRRRTTGVSL